MNGGGSAADSDELKTVLMNHSRMSAKTCQVSFSRCFGPRAHRRAFRNRAPHCASDTEPARDSSPFGLAPSGKVRSRRGSPSRRPYRAVVALTVWPSIASRIRRQTLKSGPDRPAATSSDHRRGPGRGRDGPPRRGRRNRRRPPPGQVGIISRWPEVVVPPAPAPGSWTEWVASKTTGAPVACICGIARKSLTSRP